MRKGDIMRKINSTEEIYMKLLRLQIEKLYGHYNYNNRVFNTFFILCGYPTRFTFYIIIIYQLTK